MKVSPLGSCRLGDESADRKTNDDVCSTCSSEYECGKLKLALTMLEVAFRQNIDFYAEDCADALEKRLKNYGWGYPNSRDECWLANKRSVVRDLTDEAIKILDVVNRKL